MDTFDDNRLAGLHPNCPRCLSHTMETAADLLSPGVNLLRCTVCQKLTVCKDQSPRGRVWHTVINGYSSFECNWAKGTILFCEECPHPPAVHHDDPEELWCEKCNCGYNWGRPGPRIDLPSVIVQGETDG